MVLLKWGKKVEYKFLILPIKKLTIYFVAPGKKQFIVESLMI